MKLPRSYAEFVPWLFRRLPTWDYLCPACEAETSEHDTRCPHCGVVFEVSPDKRRIPSKVNTSRKAREDYVHRHIFPTLSKGEQEWMAQWFTVLWSDNFDDGNDAGWTGETLTTGETIDPSTSAAHHGAYGERAVTNGSAAGERALLYYTFGATQQTLYVRAYMRWSTLPTASGRFALMDFRYSGNYITACDLYNAAGTYKWRVWYYSGVNNTVASAGVSVSANTWYCVMLYTYVHDVNGVVNLFIDGTSAVSASNVDTNGRGGNIDTFRIGYVYNENTQAVTLDFDCVIAADQLLGVEVDRSPSDGLTLADSVSRLLQKPRRITDGFMLKSEGSIEMERSIDLPAEGLNLYDVMSSQLIAGSKSRSLTDYYLYGDGQLFNWDNLILYIPFQESSGVLARDWGGKGYDGDISGNPTWVAGKYDNALDFDGTGDYVDCGDVTELNSVAAFTICFWLNQDNVTSDQRIMRKYVDINNDIMISSYISRFYAEVGNGSNSWGYWADYATEIASGTWFHAAIVYDGTQADNPSKLKLFINGVQKTLTFNLTIPTTTANLAGANFLIGQNVDALANLAGVVDDLFIFQRALSQGEIQGLMNRWFDVPIVSLGRKRTYSDALTLGDSVSRLFSRAVKPTDSLNLADALIQLKRFGRFFSDALTLADSSSPILSKRRALADGYTLADTLLRQTHRRMLLTDAETLSDAFSRRFIRAISPSDALTLSDIVYRRFIKWVLATDVLSLSDSLYSQKTVKKAMSDYLTLADSTNVSRDRRISQLDALTLSDETRQVRSLSQALTDALTLADSVSTLLITPVVNLTIAEALTLADTLTTQLKKTLSLIDGITLADNTRLSRTIKRSLADGQTLHDELLTQMKRAIALSDASTLADALQIAFGRYRTFLDGLTLADSLAKRTFANRAMADYYTLADSAYTLISRRELLSDAYSLSDLLNLSIIRAKVLTDALTLRDDASLRRIRNSALSDALLLSDAHSELLTKVVKISDRMTLADSLLLRTLRQITMTDGFTLTDTVSLTTGVLKTVSITDGITLFDGIARSVARNIGIVDGFYLWSEAVRSSQLRRSLAEAMTLSDSSTTLLYGVRNVTLTDALRHSDSLVRYIAKNILLLDGILLGDDIVQKRTFNKIILDAFTLYDLCPRPPMTLKLSLTDALSLHEWSHTPLVSVVKGPIQTLTFKSIAQYLEYLRSGKLPDESVARDG